MDDADFLSACAALAPTLGAEADEGEQLRRVSDDAMRAVHDTDILRALGAAGVGTERAQPPRLVSQPGRHCVIGT